MRVLSRTVLCACVGIMAAVAGAEGARPAKPNVVIVLIDDLGWQDVKCYDIDEPSPMETPNIDALAKKGVMFWQGYSPSPVCAPSRAAILSGEHPARIEMTHVAGGMPPHPGSPNAAMISPWYSARMPVETFTLAEALKAEGYVTGHSGKWHVSKHHYDYPNPYHHGFDESTHDRGVQCRMKPDRLTEFATTDPDDPYRLDENGYPFDVPQDAAMRFVKEHKGEPFFLYYATWLVHGPWVMRSEALLRKYERKLGVTITEKHKDGWDVPGQKNPFYCAMVEQLDYYVGQLFDYLAATEDPRWPGHKLSENTYIIFTSDNGGMEMSHMVTDNYPLDGGKISLREGGTRVPLIITGPGIPAGVETEVMANGLDFYPTILSWVGATKPAGKIFDGCDLAPLLSKDPTDASLVRDSEGRVRDTMVWHFPQAEHSSSLRVGDYKVFRHYYGTSATVGLHPLYNTEDGESARGDIEEKQDLATKMPEKTAELDAELTEMVQAMGGRLPYGNPASSHDLPNKEKAPTILGHKQSGSTIEVTYELNGAGIAYADLIYTPNDGREWLRASGHAKGAKAIFDLPRGTSHYFINLVDENNFIAIYPPIDRPRMQREKLEFKDVAIFSGYPEPKPGKPVDFAALYSQLSAADGKARVLLAKDLETAGLAPLHVVGKGLSITEDVAGTGTRCIKMVEVESDEQAWMPLVSKDVAVPAEITSGVYRFCFDVMLGKDAPGVLQVALKQGNSVPGHVMIGDGGIKANSRNVCGVEPGTWYHVDISCRFGEVNNRMLSLAVTAADGRSWRQEIPYTDMHFDRPGTIQIVGLGAVGGAAYLDNLSVRVEGE